MKRYVPENYMDSDEIVFWFPYDDGLSVLSDKVISRIRQIVSANNGTYLNAYIDDSYDKPAVWVHCNNISGRQAAGDLGEKLASALIELGYDIDESDDGWGFEETYRT